MKRTQVIRMAAAVAVAVALLTATASFAQSTVTQKNTQKETATITAINKATREITLKTSSGAVEDIVAGPEMQRFDALKVGDKVTFTYHESLVYQIRKAGTAPAASTTGAAITRTAGDKPGGTITQRQNATVTVEAVDKDKGHVSVRTAEGHGITAIVEDKKNLNDVKVGDKVDITYTEAVMISVESAK